MGPFVVLSTQRSGTIMLEWDLNTHPDVHCYGELYSRNYTGPLSFRDFSSPLPWRPPQGHLRCVSRRPERAIGLRVMYNHLKVPGLTAALRRRETRIVHMVRRDLLSQHVSRITARSRRQWYAAPASDVKPIQVVVPTAGLVDLLAQREAVIESHRRWCSRFLHLELSYEDYVADKVREQARLLAFLEVDDGVALDGSTRKLNSAGLGSIIVNYQEVEATLRGTRFALQAD